jgi:DNA modification methylase
LDKLREIDEESVNSVVTDPPYGLSFMGKAWDKNVPSETLRCPYREMHHHFGFFLPAAGMTRYKAAEENEVDVKATVKPTNLMRYLVRLVTSPGGIVLDPFMGSGSTGKAAILESFNFIGIELDSEYFSIAQARINHAQNSMSTSLDDFLTDTSDQ